MEGTYATRLDVAGRAVVIEGLTTTDTDVVPPDDGGTPALVGDEVA